MSKIWVNGCFDIVHVGHLKMFQYAKSLGKELRVGIDSDMRVKILKGNDRPIFHQEDRKYFLNALECIDSVVVYDTAEEMASLIKEYEPDLMVVGDDYRNKPVVGEEYSRAVAFYKKHRGYSTTNIIDQITLDKIYETSQ
jgi:rfaE bifunctional protein nucleotidyltransferase chain/domain